MRILIITQWYKPIRSAASNRLSRMARHLQKKGHEVVILTGMPSYPTGILPEKYKRKLVYKELIEDIKVLRTYEYPAPNRGVFRRLFNNFSFMFSSCLAVLFLPKYDLVIASSPAFLVGITGMLAKIIFKAKFIFDVRDLWPDSAVELGYLQKEWIINLLKKLEKKYYEVSDKIFTATPSIKEHIVSEGVNRNKVEVLYNSVNTDMFKIKKINRKDYGFSERDFIFSFTGNHGAAQGLECTIKAAAILKDQAGIKFLFVGEGEEKEKLVKLTKKLKLKNIIFWPEKSQEEIVDVINFSDCGNISLSSQKIFQEAIPSKTMEYWACGKPVIAGVGGVLANTIEKYQVGIAYKGGDEKALAKAILRLYNHSKLALKMGQNAHSLALETFSDQSFYRTLDRVIERLDN